MNRGCVFLSRRTPASPEGDAGVRRGCLLHSPESNARLTAKPIDCVFFTCVEPREFRIPSEPMSERWFRALATAYPGSVERFRRLIEDAPLDITGGV